MSDELEYRYAGITTVTDAIDSFVRQMNQHLEETDTTFRALIDNGWTGAGADAFAERSRQWHLAAGAISAALHRLGAAVGDAAINMQIADKNAAVILGG
jgi:WXG100 family type VII secretion target